MRIRTATVIALGILTMGAASFAGPARADQNDSRLPALFERLAKASSSDEAFEIDAKIWDIWDQAGDADIDALLANGVAAMENGDFWTALQQFNIVVAQRPDFAEGWNKRAALYFYVGDFEKARADIAMTLTLEPRHMSALLGLGAVEQRQGHYEDAVNAYRRVLAIDPQNKTATDLLELAGTIIRRTSF